ncbi:hypothetical protein [Streptomyces olivaceus]|uniref:hypothetical protein n=1 Tax=Streptomyces olivaceus TaxID=47716 RepID=UPI00340A4A47
MPGRARLTPGAWVPSVRRPCRGAFPPDPASASAARDFVLGALPGTASHLADTARLLAGGLATNAVLHARTEFEVAVGATTAGCAYGSPTAGRLERE